MATVREEPGRLAAMAAAAGFTRRFVNVTRYGDGCVRWMPCGECEKERDGREQVGRVAALADSAEPPVDL